MSRVILVSNRLPVAFHQVDGKPVPTRSAGGLVAALAPVHDAGESIWLGTFDLSTGGPHLEKSLLAQRLVPVHLDPDDARRHYEGFSNQVVWPLFHYLLTRITFDNEDWQSYVRVNEAFAAAVVRVARPGDFIWVHDYHLMLLPEMLRQRLPDVCSGFFLHIPFPSSEVFRILPHKEEILRGLSGANVVGLHTYDYARHLVSCFRRVLGIEFDEDWVRLSDGRCRVGVFPLGIDVASFAQRAQAPAVEERVQQLRQRVLGRRVLLGVDRMDYTKGLPLRLESLARLLETRPFWRDKVVLFQLAVPSRANIDAYQELKDEVERLVGEINGRFAVDGIVPIHYMYRSVSQDELAALYRLADVALVTPVRDGMNLVCKEYVASRFDNTGVLVLSEFAGAASEMGEALLVNPWDIDGTAHTFDRALSLAEEQVFRRMQGLRRRVAKNHVGRWVDRFLEAMRFFARPRPGVRTTPAVAVHVAAEQVWSERLATEFAEAHKALVALDYDGSLTEIVATPDLAAPSSAIRALLQQLGGVEDVEVVVISGRDPQTLGTWLGELPVSLVAEHGVQRRFLGANAWEQTLVDADLTWKEPVRELLDDYTARSPGSFVEEKPFSLVWHYREVEPGFGMWQARELAQHLSEAYANSPVAVLHGAKVVEIRPQGMDKGRALLGFLGARGPFDFCLVAGDDRTDEDMFTAAAPEHWTIKVGLGATHARHGVVTPADLRDLLGRLVEARQSHLRLRTQDAATDEGL